MKKTELLSLMELGSWVEYPSTVERIRLDAAGWHAAAKKVAQIEPEKVFCVRQDSFNLKVIVRRVDQKLPFEGKMYNSRMVKVQKMEPGQYIFYECPEGKTLRAHVKNMSSLGRAAERKYPGREYSVKKYETGVRIYRIK